MPNYKDLLSRYEKEYKDILAKIFESVNKQDKDLIWKNYKEAVAKLTQIYYIQIARWDSDRKVRPEYKDKKIKELEKGLAGDINKLAVIVDEYISIENKKE